MKIDSSVSASLIPQEHTDRTGQNSLTGRVVSVKNEQVRLDGKPSYGSSVKRTFASFFNKIVRVCKVIPHKLALLVPCYGTSIVRTTDSAKESHRVNPLPKPQRTFEHRSEVSDVQNPSIMFPMGEDVITQNKQANSDLESNLSLNNIKTQKNFSVIHTYFRPCTGSSFKKYESTN